MFMYNMNYILYTASSEKRCDFMNIFHYLLEILSIIEKIKS